MMMGVDSESPTRSAHKSWRGRSSVGRRGLGKVSCSSMEWTSLIVRGWGRDDNVRDSEEQCREGERIVGTASTQASSLGDDGG